MNTQTIPEPAARVALRRCRATLRRLAEYRLDPAFDQHLRDLGENKEFLSAGEHAELMTLVAFTQQRTVEKREAALVLRDLEAAYPELAEEP